MGEIDSLPIHKQRNERRIGQRALLNIILSLIHGHLIDAEEDWTTNIIEHILSLIHGHLIDPLICVDSVVWGIAKF